jgi:hypothetical protein
LIEKNIEQLKRDNKDVFLHIVKSLGDKKSDKLISLFPGGAYRYKNFYILRGRDNYGAFKYKNKEELTEESKKLIKEYDSLIKKEFNPLDSGESIFEKIPKEHIEFKNISSKTDFDFLLDKFYELFLKKEMKKKEFKELSYPQKIFLFNKHFGKDIINEDSIKKVKDIKNIRVKRDSAEYFFEDIKEKEKEILDIVLDEDMMFVDKIALLKGSKEKMDIEFQNIKENILDLDSDNNFKFLNIVSYPKFTIDGEKIDIMIPKINKDSFEKENIESFMLYAFGDKNIVYDQIKMIEKEIKKDKKMDFKKLL